MFLNVYKWTQTNKQTTKHLAQKLPDRSTKLLHRATRHLSLLRNPNRNLSSPPSSTRNTPSLPHFYFREVSAPQLYSALLFPYVEVAYPLHCSLFRHQNAAVRRLLSLKMTFPYKLPQLSVPPHAVILPQRLSNIIKYHTDDRNLSKQGEQFIVDCRVMAVAKWWRLRTFRTNWCLLQSGSYGVAMSMWMGGRVRMEYVNSRWWTDGNNSIRI